jgi:hypothetical protein
MKLAVCELMDLFQINPLIVVIKDDDVVYEGIYKSSNDFCYKTIDSMFIDECEDSETKGYLYIYLE